MVMLFVLALAAGCGQQAKETAGGGSQGKAEVVVVGYTGPLSGPAAEYGKDNLNGVDMAINEINEAGGIVVNGKKYLFKLEKLDDMADPTQAINNARRFRDQYKAVAVFDPVFNTIAPMMEINREKGNEFLIMAYTSTPKATEMGNELLIDTTVPFDQYVVSFSETAWKEGWRKGAMVVTLGAYGDEWRQAFKKHWESIGGQIVADKPANYYTETDFSSQLTAALAAKPDFMLIGGPSATTGLVIEQARSLGFKGGFLLIEQAKPDYIADEVFKGKLDLMENVVGTAAVVDIPTAVAQAFDKKYKEKYNMHNTWEAILNYNGMHMLSMAMQEAGTVSDVYAIRAAFNKIGPLTGDKFPAECWGVTEGGRVKVPGAVQIIKGGKYSEPVSYIWWAKTEDEFNQVKSKMSNQNAVKWLKPKE